MNIQLLNNNTLDPVVNAEVLYTDENFQPYLVVRPEYSNGEGRFELDTNVSRHIQINHPDYATIETEIDGNESLVLYMYPFFNPANPNPNNQVPVKSPAFTMIFYGVLLTGMAWWFLVKN